MVVLNNETIDLIKKDIDNGKVSSAGCNVAKYIKDKNPQKNIIFALRSIKEDLKELLSTYPENLVLDQIHFSIIYEVVKDLGWEMDLDNLEVYGWGSDYFIPVEVPNENFYYTISYECCYPESHITKVYINETTSDNC